MKKAVYVGSFDPVTKGHLWIIKEGSRLFDELVVAVGTNPDKEYTFSLEERVYMLQTATRDISDVRVDFFKNQFLVDYASSIGAHYILKGIRNEADYKSERTLENVNKDLNPNISTVFLMSPKEYAEISSSFIKGLVGLVGWEDVIDRYVPNAVYNKFLQKFNGMESKWNLLCQNISAQGNCEEIYKKLVTLYSEPNRSYRNLAHIAHSLREFQGVKLLAEHPEELEMVIWFHDAVYDTRAKDNEKKSAELAAICLKEMGMRNSFINNVAKMILATAHKKVPESRDARFLLDIDISNFGQSYGQFIEHNEEVREEYSWVGDNQFKEERKRIIQNFIDRPHIYSPNFFREKYECQARQNLTAYLKSLDE